jgi:branched-chain amino acid transport system permease protein
MARFVSLLGSGLAEGALTTLAALGFILTYRATGVVNFAQGDLITLGAYLALWANTTLDAPVVGGYAISIVGLFVIGMLLERLAYAPLRGRSVHVVVMSTFGAAIVIRALLGIWKGADPQSLDSPLTGKVLRIAGGAITYQRVAIIVVALVLIVALALMISRTSFGRQLRAIADDREIARMHGVRTSTLSMLAFGLSGALAGVAGVLIAPVGAFDLTLGFGVMLNGFAATIIAGTRKLGGVVVAGFILGCVEQVFGGYVFRDYKDAYPFLLMIFIVVIKPAGLFGGTVSERF